MDKIIDLLRKYKQDHIIKILESLDEERKKILLKEISEIDLSQINDLYEDTKNEIKININKLDQIKAINQEKLLTEEKENYENNGIKIIKENKFAVATMAGGQGTRLGFNGPKGTFKIGVNPKPKFLFEIIVDTLKRANKQYNVIIPWYIMTSEENNNETINFLKEHNFFGYPKEYIKFFEQGKLPIINTNGKILIDENYHVKLASNGNGSIFESMRIKGILDDMKSKEIEWVYIGSIDNVLLKMVDILLMGIAIEEKSLIATRSIFKNNPKEKIGTICSINDKIKVIEYSEFPEEMIEAVDQNGELLFGESHVMCNLFNIKALDKISKEKLPYHKAFKKYSYIEENGKLIIPEEPNAYKFEYFIFDSFELFNQISILRGKREEDFAPVKNKSGVDSPETAIELYNNYYGTNLKP